MPNFIFQVIEEKPTYHSIYLAIIIISLLVAIQWLFTFHFMVLSNMNIKDAMNASSRLIKKNMIRFVVSMLGLSVFIFGTSYLLGIIGESLFYPIIKLANVENGFGRFLIFLFIYFERIFIGLILFLMIPIKIYGITKIFYWLSAQTKPFTYFTELYPVIEGSKRNSMINKVLSKKNWLAFFIFFLGVFFAVHMSIAFDEIGNRTNDIDIVAHRGGGNLGVENSLSGIEEGLNHGVKSIEIDVQRTKDGEYVVFHDRSLKRLSGTKKKLSKLTLSEIEEIQLHDKGFEDRIPTLNEVLDLVQGRAKVFLELKGKTADRTMADDMIQLIYERSMQKDVVLISLDYDLIQYIEANDPTIQTGYLFFFAFGDVGQLDGDYLIMEEQEATAWNITRVHSQRKKAYIWTVNTFDDVDKYIDLHVDGIITDEITEMQEAIKERKEKTNKEIMEDILLREKISFE